VAQLTLGGSRTGTLGAWLARAVDYPRGRAAFAAAPVCAPSFGGAARGLRPAAVMCRKMARFLVRLTPVQRLSCGGMVACRFSAD
jgi:hypothetical protein